MALPAHPIRFRNGLESELRPGAWGRAPGAIRRCPEAPLPSGLLDVSVDWPMSGAMGTHSPAGRRPGDPFSINSIPVSFNRGW